MIELIITTLSVSALVGLGLILKNIIENEKIVVDIYDLRFNMVYHKETETGSYNEILEFIVSTLKNAEKEQK